MSDLLAKCDWLGDVLVLTLPQDPSSILVCMFDSPFAPKKEYIPKSEYRKMERWYNKNLVVELSENKKLRELCMHLYTCICYCDRNVSDGGCSACPYQSVENDCSFDERLLELGIEV